MATAVSMVLGGTMLLAASLPENGWEKLPGISFQVAMELVLETYRLTRALPESERYGLISQKALEQLQRRLRVPPALNDDVQHLALVIDGAPQEHALSADRADHFVEMPARGRGGT